MRPRSFAPLYHVLREATGDIAAERAAIEACSANPLLQQARTGCTLAEVASNNCSPKDIAELFDTEGENPGTKAIGAGIITGVAALPLLGKVDPVAIMLSISGSFLLAYAYYGARAMEVPHRSAQAEYIDAVLVRLRG